VSITTIHNRIIPDGKSLWSGKFHFLVRSDCDLEYLQGAIGGFVSAIALADSEGSFVQIVFTALRSRKLEPDDEFDEIENLSERYRNKHLSDEWTGLSDFALDTGRAVFNTFDLYDSE
jgi:hypothetical protein